MVQDESPTRLEIDYRLVLEHCLNEDNDALCYGSLWFNNGADICRAAVWQGKLLCDFLRDAIRDYLEMVMMAMGEEQAGAS